MGGHSECFSVLRVHSNAVVCDIYVVKLLFRDTLPQRSFENSSRMKHVRLRIDKLLPKIGSSPYLVKKLHTQFRPSSMASGERTLAELVIVRSHSHVIHTLIITSKLQKFSAIFLASYFYIDGRSKGRRRAVCERVKLLAAQRAPNILFRFDCLGV